MNFTFDSHAPRFTGEGHFIAPGAMLVGNVMLEAGCSVWFNAVVRADSGRIVVHEGANIQDCAVAAH